MNKCTDFIPTNALHDFHVPTHCSGVKNKQEVSFLLKKINSLLLLFEGKSMSTDSSFGVKKGRWFDENENTYMSQYKQKFAKDMGLCPKEIDWRLYGCTLIFKADKLKMHKDIYNCTEDNYSMVVTFNSIFNFEDLPSYWVNCIKEELKNNIPSLLNMTVVICGRRQLTSLLNKITLRKDCSERNPLVRYFIKGVLRDHTWGYEAWLHDSAFTYIQSQIDVLRNETLMRYVSNFKSSLSQSESVQMMENKLFKMTFCVIPAMMSKQLYWSSYATIYFRLQLTFELNEYEMFEVFLFLATESNGQCLLWQVFTWHVMSMNESELRSKIENSGSLYVFLCSILENTINR